MKKEFYKDALGWGFLLWLFGYMLGIVLFFVVSPSALGWVIMPFGILYTLWVLSKKILSKDWRYYLGLSVVWTVIAIILDYFLIVKVFKPADGYYKLDVYIYYGFTFALPLLVGLKKRRFS